MNLATGLLCLFAATLPIRAQGERRTTRVPTSDHIVYRGQSHSDLQTRFVEVAESCFTEFHKSVPPGLEPFVDKSMAEIREIKKQNLQDCLAEAVSAINSGRACSCVIKKE